MVRRWVKNPAWTAACTASFGDPLRAVLGTEEARRLAVRWPEYVQKALERALRRDAAPENPFLALMLLGMYEEDREPYYARNGGPFNLTIVEAKLADVPDLGRFDLISMGADLDLASEAEIQATVALLAKVLRPGAVAFMRQLGARRSLRPFFEESFWFDSTAGRRFAERDRSVLHSRFEVAVKR
jgi:S-adenosylmethionine-diacylglycerol 3-amino-3-carboxypropyl transferase